MKQNAKTFRTIYFLNFLLALSWALPSYVESSYLGQFVSVQYIGLVLAAATAAILPVALFYPYLIQRHGNYHIMQIGLLSTILLLLALFCARSGWAAILLFIVYYIPASLLAINIDVFLEDVSDDRHTGKIRSNLLLAANIAWVCSPLIMGWIAANGNYGNVFLAAALALLPATCILLYQSKILRDRYRYFSRPPSELLSVIVKNPNLSKIFLLALALRFFYFIMVMYIPLHLHQNLGFSWTTIGWVLTVMLVPFLIIQPPAGRIADRYLGEQEMMIAGFVIMAVSTFIIFFTTSLNPLWWAALLFFTRVGAALVEAMQESYFFKQVDRRDVDLINLYRNVGSAGWLLGATFAFIVLLFLPFAFLFLLLALVMVIALWPALTLCDTK